MTWKLKTYVRWSTDNEIWLKNNLLFRSTTDWWTFDWWLHGVMTDKREKPTQLQYTCICFTLRALRSAVECVKIEGKNLEAIKCLNKCVTDSFMPCTVYNLSWGEKKPIWGLTESVNKWQHYLRIYYLYSSRSFWLNSSQFLSSWGIFSFYSCTIATEPYCHTI